MKYILVLIVLFDCTLLSAQRKGQNEIKFDRIIKVDTSLRKDEIFNLVDAWFEGDVQKFNITSSEFKRFLWGISHDLKSKQVLLDNTYRIDQPVKTKDQEKGIFTGVGSIKYSGGIGCIRLMYLTFDLAVFAKDGRYRVVVNNFTYTHYNTANLLQMQLYGWKDEGVCSSRNTLEELTKCDHCIPELNKFYTYVNTEIEELIKSLETHISRQNKILTEDW